MPHLHSVKSKHKAIEKVPSLHEPNRLRHRIDDNHR